MSYKPVPISLSSAAPLRPPPPRPAGAPPALRVQKSVFLPPSALTARLSIASEAESADSGPPSPTNSLAPDEVDFSLATIRTRPRSQALSLHEKTPQSQSSASLSVPGRVEGRSRSVSRAPPPPVSPSKSSGPLSPAAVAAALASSSSVSPLQAASTEALERLHSKLLELGDSSSSRFPSSSALIRLDRLKKSIEQATILHSPAHAQTLSHPVEQQWNTIITSGLSVELLRSSHFVRSLVGDSGVPPTLRPVIWMKLSGAEDEKSKFPVDYYTRLCSIYSEHGSSFDEEIEKDVRRTLPSLQLYQSGTSEPAKSLTRILAAYSLRNSITGYCQGMNTLAGYLLTIVDEESAFWILVKLVESRAGYYSRSMVELEVDLRVLKSLLQFNLPNVAAQFQRFEVGVESFAVSWFVCLMCDAPLPLPECATFWDSLFVWGDELLFQLPILILQQKQKEIQGIQEAVELLEFLLHSGMGMKEKEATEWENVLKSLKPGRFSVMVEQLREFHRGEVVKMARQLNPNTARRLASQHRLQDSSQVQALWESFLEPAPWAVMLHSALASPLRFTQALIGRVFTDQQRAKWRDPGILCGVFDRLFQTVDVAQSGYVTFEQFLMLSRILMLGSVEERLKLAFQFFDENRDQRVSQIELSTGFEKLHKLYNGVGEKEEEKDVSRLFAQMIFDRCITSRERIEEEPRRIPLSTSFDGDAGDILHHPIDQRGLPFAHFAYLITLHPFSQAFFSLPEHSGGAI